MTRRNPCSHCGRWRYTEPWVELIVLAMIIAATAAAVVMNFVGR